MNYCDEIGVAAWLEGLAEECSELSHAALKLARKLRGENPTPAKLNDILNELCEEIADVEVYIEALYNSDEVDVRRPDVIRRKAFKKDRMRKRISEMKGDV